jgi:hypothetical protein
MTETKDQCPVCTGTTIVDVHRRADVPVFVNRLGRSAQDAVRTARGQLRLIGCQTCGFVWNAAFDPGLITYDLNYENDQAHSQLFAEHLRERIEDLLGAVPGDQPIDYLEVGCGQGQFIELVAEAAGSRLRSAVGFDPAWRGDDGQGPGRSRIHKVYFNAETAGRLDRPPNIVASRHTIEHVPDPVGFLKALNTALGGAASIPILLETPRVEWIFENNAIHDLFYEHCSLFSERAMYVALRRAGFSDIRTKPVFGGQYQWAEARTSALGTLASSTEDEIGKRELSWLKPLDATYQEYVANWEERMRRARERGPVAIWGAGAKGVSFALMMNSEAKLIDAAIDINPAKQGGFLPGSGLEVISPEAAVKRGMSTVIIMNPNYHDEVVAMLAKLGAAADAIRL